MEGDSGKLNILMIYRKNKNKEYLNLNVTPKEIFLTVTETLHLRK